MIIAKDKLQDRDLLACVGAFLYANGVGSLNLEDSEKDVDFARSLSRFSGSIEGGQGGDFVQAELKVWKTSDGGGARILDGGACFLRLIGSGGE